jgi:hypothetical protein
MYNILQWPVLMTEIMIQQSNEVIYKFLALTMVVLDRLIETHIPVNICMLPSLK